VLAGFSGNTRADCFDAMHRLCAEGWFVFGLDYPGFGRSGGTRQRHRPLEQAQSAYDGLTYMQTLPGIDPERLGIYGTSFGGANGIWVTAHDERVKCLVTSVPVTDGQRWASMIRRPFEWHAFRDRVAAGARKRVLVGLPEFVPASELMPRDPDTVRQFEMHRQAGHGAADDERDLESAEALFRYRPEWVIDRISPRPVLMIYADRDNRVPPDMQLSCFAKCGEPKKLVCLQGAGHYDSYESRNPETSRIVYDETIAWFAKYLDRQGPVRAARLP
jgi:pimeloyl-ACP methyl ester carboxylesterase